MMRKMIIKNDLTKPPSHAAKKDTHYWADYLEIISLFNKDNLFSQNDFIDRIVSKRDLEDSEDFELRNNSLRNDLNSLLAEDVFSLITYRHSVFNDYYPFHLSNDHKTIHVSDNLTTKQKVYLFLLFSSSLGIFKDFTSKLTSSFERLSLEILKKILPKNSNAYIFGSSNVERMSDANTKNNSFWEKLNLLSENLRERVIIDKSDLSERNRGDGGLDLYAWMDLGDSNKNFPIFFCQCACTPEWTVKQFSSKFDSWNEFITLSTYPLNFIFIPYSFRKANGAWHEPYQIKKSVLVDRERLLHILSEEESMFESFEAYEIINTIITYKEGVV